MPTGRGTFISSGNSWVDEWDHGLSMADIGPGYRVFQTGSLARTLNFRHQNHWMVDVAGVDGNGPPPYDTGGSTLRPDRSFRFESGKLVVEADVAAGIAEYGGAVWPELVVTTAPQFTGHRADGIYNYDEYAGHYTLGMRLQPSREPIAAFFDNSTRGPGQGGRVFEISHFQNGASSWGEGGSLKWGGHPSIAGLGSAWRVCRGQDPDTFCRDRFRWEIERDHFTVYVNGVKYMEHGGFPAAQQLPDAFVNSDVYVYFGSWIFKPGQTTRFHWDRLAVNPPTGPSPAPGAGGGGPQPTATRPSPTSVPGAPTPAATATPTPRPGAPPSPGQSQTLSFDDLPGERLALSGQYPSGVIDWGSGQWYLSPPWRRFSSKSISFVRGSSSASFTFLQPRRLISLRAHNGGQQPSTVTLVCPGQPTKTATLAPDELVTIATGWTGTCTSVTISTTNGWDTNFDDLVISL